MKHNHKLTFQQVKTGYILALEARHLSPHTIEDYQNTFNRFMPFIGKDTVFEDITSQDVQRFLASVTGVTNSTLLHYYAALAAMWSWAVKEEIVPLNIVHKLDAPKAEEREILPFTEIVPLSGLYIPVISFKRVDFPEPFLPIIPTELPRGIRIRISLRTSV